MRNSDRSGSHHADASEAWYITEGKRGQQLMDHGQLDRATVVFEAILARLGNAPSYGRAVILERGSIVHQSDSASLRADRAVMEQFLGVTQAVPRRKRS